jgi:hypothetical protein
MLSSNLGSLLVVFIDSCQTVFQELKIRRKHRYIIFKIGDEFIDVETVGPRSAVSCFVVETLTALWLLFVMITDFGNRRWKRWRRPYLIRTADM